MMNPGANMPFLIFIDGTDDAVMYPLHSLISITCAADTSIRCRFQSSLGAQSSSSSYDYVNLTITAGTERRVMRDIAEAVAQAIQKGEGYVTVCDDVDSIFCSDGITACAWTIDS